MPSLLQLYINLNLIEIRLEEELLLFSHFDSICFYLFALTTIVMVHLMCVNQRLYLCILQNYSVHSLLKRAILES